MYPNFRHFLFVFLYLIPRGNLASFLLKKIAKMIFSSDIPILPPQKKKALTQFELSA